MVDSSIVQRLLAINDEEKGGDNALDGFEFQVSSAIYLIFNELKKDKDFALLYEKVEDFIIVNEKVNLYQAKSISNNLTPNILHKPSRVTKKDNSGLSIIEKIYQNYNKVIESLDKQKVECHLLICENYYFSKKLSGSSEGIKDIKILCFNDFSQDTKQEIINATCFGDYEWSKIFAYRLIPKPRHEEVTRAFIEDTINELLGDNKINTTALYNALTYEIKRIRKKKSFITKAYLSNQIYKYTSLDDDIKFSDYSYLFNENDKKSIQLNLLFNKMKNLILINNHPSQEDYLRVKDYFSPLSIDNIYDIFDEIKSSMYFEDINIRLSNNEIKALILILVAKELN
jgi:hypothetical protein